MANRTDFPMSTTASFSAQSLADGEQRHVDCPICGSALSLPVHRAGGPWTLDELHWARKMLGSGMTSKAVARVMDVSEPAMKRAVSADALHAGRR